MKRYVLLEVDDTKDLDYLEEAHSAANGPVISASECQINGDKIKFLRGSELLSRLRWLHCPE